jgi:glycerol-3-phosphate O-acyltransferase
VVPVCVNYDRLFDSRYLSNEIISGKFQNFNIAELMYYIYKTRPGKLGKIFVKYAEPINLYDYIDKYKDD